MGSTKQDPTSPIITDFKDGAEVSRWVAALKAGEDPDTALVEELKTQGWIYLEATLKDCSEKPNRFVKVVNTTLSRFVVSRCIDYNIQPTIRLLTKPYYVADDPYLPLVVIVTKKEGLLFHGHEKGGAERPVRIYLDHRPGQPHSVLVCNQTDEPEAQPLD